MKIISNISDKVLKEKTGKGWEEWINILDKDKAIEMNHKEMATHLCNKYKVDSWYAQTISNGYEKEKGLRVKHEKATGDFEISKTKVFNIEHSKLFDLVKNLIEKDFFGHVEITTLNENKNIRLKGSDKNSFSFDFYNKENKTQLVIQQFKIKDSNEAEEMKKFWSNKLKELEEKIK